MDFSNLLADRTQIMGVNVIREILKVVSRAGNDISGRRNPGS